MHSIGQDLIVMWTGVIVLEFAFLMFGSVSIYDNENIIMTFGSMAIVLIAAIVITIGQLFGWIGAW
jgi:hypothetical protein